MYLGCCNWCSLLFLLSRLANCGIVLRRKPGCSHVAFLGSIASTVNRVSLNKRTIAYFARRTTNYCPSRSITLSAANILKAIPWWRKRGWPMNVISEFSLVAHGCRNCSRPSHIAILVDVLQPQKVFFSFALINYEREHPSTHCSVSSSRLFPIYSCIW